MNRQKSELYECRTDPALIREGRIVTGMRFDERVWAVTARIPPGRVTTYGRIAALLGTRGARAVGAALARNPHAPAVPCHRVVGADGRLTGFAAGLTAKRRLLQDEGVTFVGDRVATDRIINPPAEPVPI